MFFRPICLWVSLALPLGACGGGAVSPAMVSAAQKRWPDASAESLEAGRALFRDKCKTCHALPDPKAHSAQAWPKILNKMARLAELDAAGHERVLRYVTAARDVE